METPPTQNQQPDDATTYEKDDWVERLRRDEERRRWLKARAEQSRRNAEIRRRRDIILGRRKA